jgi:hypothetical protein
MVDDIEATEHLQIKLPVVTKREADLGDPPGFDEYLVPFHLFDRIMY